jgi:hypothetical protein
MAHSAAAKPMVATPDLIRTLAHEIRQPLSTIESIAYYLTLILPDDEKTREQLDRIQLLVEQSNWMLTSAQLLTDPIAPTRDLVSLHDLAGCESREDLPLIHGDPSLRAAIGNLEMLSRQYGGSFQLQREGESVCIELRAQGTTLPGVTLSLEGSRRVIEAHGGSFDLTIDATGIKLRVLLT